MVTLNLHHRGLRGTEVPYILRRIILGGLARLVLLRFDVDERHSSPASTPTSGGDPSGRSSGDPIPASRLASRNFNESPTKVCTSAGPDLRCTCGKSSHGGGGGRSNVHQRGGRPHPSVGVSATRSSSGWFPTPVNGGPPGGRNSQERLRLRLQVKSNL